MPKRRKVFVSDYDLKKSFTSASGKEYTPGNLVLWSRYSDTTIIDDAAGHATTDAVSAGSISGPFNEKTTGNLRDVAIPGGTGAVFLDSDDFTFGTGSGNPDTSFSVSMWINSTDLNTSGVVFQKYDEYRITIGSYDIEVAIGKISSTAAYVKATTPTGDNVLAGLDNSWINIVVTYTAQPGGATVDARENIKIYANGSEITGLILAAVGTYAGMIGTANTLQVAPAASNTWETALWSGRVLTSTEVQALYDAANGLADDSIKSREYRTFTGTTSLANRPYMHMLDNATGSYPTIARIGSERSGKYNVPFDDTNTITFQEYGATDVLNDALVIQGTQTTSGTRFSGSLVASPNTMPDLTVVSSKTQVPAGIADSRVTMTPGQDLGPFIEHQLYASDKIGSGDPFWATGSLPADAGPGFELPIWEKTKIEIDLTAIESTTFGFDTGSIRNTKPMVYFNHSLRRWESIGKTYNPHNSEEFFGKATAGFTDSIATDFPAHNSGWPYSNLGFPSHPRYHATSSQSYSLESTINAPFVAEKMILEFSGSCAVIDPATAKPRSAIQNFFILNQRGPFHFDDTIQSYENPATLAGSVSMIIPSSTSVTDTGSDLFIDDVRDIVTFSQVSIYDPSFGVLPAGATRDLNVASTAPYTGLPTSTYLALQPGTHVLSASIRTPLKANTISRIEVESGGPKFVQHFNLGTRSGLGVQSGRSLANDFTAQTFSGSFEQDGTTFPLTKKFFDTSPYILMPSDQIVLGWQAPLGTGGPGWGIDYPVSSSIYSGPSKLTIYGSLLRDGKEFHQGLNQLLTSDSVHEDIQDSVSLSGNAYCLDQINTAYYSQFSGSYLDRAFGGFDPRSESSAAGRIDTSPNSIVNGLAGSTGSIFRGVRLSDGNERYYDSLMPAVSHIAEVNGNSFRLDNDGIITVAPQLGLYPLGNTSHATNPDVTWPRSFPFDEIYGGSDLIRSSEALVVKPKKTLGDVDLDPQYIKYLNSFSILTPKQSENEAANDDHYLSTDGTDSVPDSKKKFLKGFFGFGDSVSYNLPIVKVTGTSGFGAQIPIGNDVIIRGFKYGLISALPAYTTCIFRHDRYGQFRDMLEQRPAATTDKTFSQVNGQFIRSPAGQNSAPVTVSFIKTVAAPGGASSAKEVLTTADKDEIAQAIGGNVRELWNSRSNIDGYSRTTRPFFDSDRDVPTAATSSGIDVYQADILNTLNSVPTQNFLTS
tara:strand:+ start:330 stop:3980 length:3651 start_codon:yes stop_codon:yes gene_type:complete